MNETDLEGSAMSVRWLTEAEQKEISAKTKNSNAGGKNGGSPMAGKHSNGNHHHSPSNRYGHYSLLNLFFYINRPQGQKIQFRNNDSLFLLRVGKWYFDWCPIFSSKSPSLDKT